MLVDRLLSDGRHIILGDVDGPHRLWLRTVTVDRPVAYVIVRDEAVDARCAAIRRLDRRLAGAPPARSSPPGFQPTPFQRQRFNLLLDILDARAAPTDHAPTTHEIGTRLVYPGKTIGRGSEWKSSSERRRTQRLIDEAVALMEGAYLGLLLPGHAGATKATR